MYRVSIANLLKDSSFRKSKIPSMAPKDMSNDSEGFRATKNPNHCLAVKYKKKEGVDEA